MPSSEQSQLQQAVQDLSSPDVKTRATAAKALLSAGLREFSGLRKDILASEECWVALLHALSDTDAKVVENSAGALAQVVGRYRRDLSAFEPLRSLLTNKNKNIRSYGVRGLAYLDHPDRWNALIPMLDDKVEPVQKEAVLAMVHHAAQIPPADRALARQAMERRLPTAGLEMKMITENAIRVLNEVG